MSPFLAKTSVFEGPLEVLLNLIDARKLSVSQISLAQVADDFVQYAKKFEEFPIAESANFILIASTLLLIKSKSLLPSLELTEEEKMDIGELERRLAVYKKVREYAAALRARFGKKILFAFEERPRAVVFSPDKSLTKDSIVEAVRALLANFPRAGALPKVVIEKVLSLDEMITRLTGRIQSSLRLGFRDFAKAGAKAKKEIIVSFLAVLELVRRGAIRATQESQFGDIMMETDEVVVPKYQ